MGRPIGSKNKKSVTAPVDAPSEVRAPIKQMLSPQGEKDFVASLPASTAEAPTEKTRKPRTPKTPEPVIDLRLERAKGKAAGLGAAQLLKSGFTAVGKPLDSQEVEDVDDQFYLIAKKAGVDPTGSWLFVVIYTLVLIVRLIAIRTSLGEEVEAWMKNIFTPKKQEGETKEEVTNNDASA